MIHWSRSSGYPGYEQALIDGHLHTRPCTRTSAAVLLSMDNVVRALELFEKAKENNPYLYFELAYTRQTEWMCWLIDKQGGGRNVLCEAQGMTPDEAALNVRLTLEAMTRKI